MWDSKIVNEALMFATEKHKNQNMYYPSEMPYSAHIFGVTLNAIKYGESVEQEINFDYLVCMALLHDTLEDTDTTFDELSERFGEKIAKGVLALTKNENLPKEMQMKDSIERIKKQPIEVWIVKLSDRLFNMRGIVPTWGKEKLLKYKVEAQYICDELGGASEKLKQDLQKSIDNYL